MADLAETDWTVTFQPAGPHNPWIQGTKRFSDVKLVVGDGALTYPANGIPAPTYLRLGMTRNVEALSIYDAADTALDVKYDVELHTIRLYNAGAEVATGAAIPAQEYFAQVRGW